MVFNSPRPCSSCGFDIHTVYAMGSPLQTGGLGGTLSTVLVDVVGG